MDIVINNSKLKQGEPSRPAWCLEETTDPVDYLHERGDQISRGTFKEACQPDQKYPHRSRSDNAVHCRFELVSTSSHQRLPVDLKACYSFKTLLPPLMDTMQSMVEVKDGFLLMRRAHLSRQLVGRR